MKLSIALATIALATSCVLGGPISVQDNNIGDIVTVGVNIKADINTEIDTTIVNVLVALLTKIGDMNLELPVAAPRPEIDGPVPDERRLLNDDLLKTIGNLKALAAISEQPKEQVEKNLSANVEQVVQQLLKQKN